jgi:hypothetical protein
MRYLLLFALCSLLQAAIDPVKAEACVQISNEFILKDTEVGKNIAASKHPQHDTLKRLSVDVLIYCYNHIQATLAMKIVAGQAPLDAPEAKQVCKYRKHLFESKESEISVTDSQQKHSQMIIDAAKSHKTRRPKPKVADL